MGWSWQDGARCDTLTESFTTDTMTTTFAPETNLSDLCFNALMEEWFWLEEQPQTKQITDAIDKCWEEIGRRVARMEELEATFPVD